MSDDVITLAGVTFGYRRSDRSDRSDPSDRSELGAVLRDVTLAIGRGQFVGIIGPNGSGKSTLMRLMSGVLRPWRGSVAVEGRAVEQYERRALGRLIGVVPQETAIAFPFSVLETVLFGRTPHLGGFGFESARDLEIARRAMARTDVAALARRPITELSGGERQRVILARALAQEPSILLLDEPAAFLDIRHEVEMYDLLRELQQGGMTIVSILHDLNIAALYCDRLILLHDGAIARSGVPAEVITYANLTEVYGTEVYVAMNDITGSLNVLPLSREHRERLRAQFAR